MNSITLNQPLATGQTSGTDFSEKFDVVGRRASAGTATEFRVTAVETSEVPDSFLRGMADFENGRTVDFENTLNNPPTGE